MSFILHAFLICFRFRLRYVALSECGVADDICDQGRLFFVKYKLLSPDPVFYALSSTLLREFYHRRILPHSSLIMSDCQCVKIVSRRIYCALPMRPEHRLFDITWYQWLSMAGAAVSLISIVSNWQLLLWSHESALYIKRYVAKNKWVIFHCDRCNSIYSIGHVPWADFVAANRHLILYAPRNDYLLVTANIFPASTIMISTLIFALQSIFQIYRTSTNMSLLLICSIININH